MMVIVLGDKLREVDEPAKYCLARRSHSGSSSSRCPTFSCADQRPDCTRVKRSAGRSRVRSSSRAGVPRSRSSRFTGRDLRQTLKRKTKRIAGDGEDRCHAREVALFACVTCTRYVNEDVWTSMAAIFPIPYILFVFL